MLLIDIHKEKITMNARITVKLSIYFLMDPGESRFLALETKNNDTIPKTTVVMLIIAIVTISYTS